MQYLIAIRSFILILFARNCLGDVFSAIKRMEELVKTENIMINILKDYIDKTEKKIQLLNGHLEELNINHKEAQKDMETYISNPLNAYLLTKRLTTDWENVEKILMKNIGKEALKNITYLSKNNLLLFPTEEDLNGAADAIVRLQELYNLKTSSLAKGDVKGVQAGSELSSSDCFELGKQCHDNEDFHNCIKWTKEAFHKYHEEINKTSDEYNILDYLSYCSFMEGDIESAYHLTGKLLKIDSSVKYIQENHVFYKNALKQQKILLKQRNESDIIRNITKKEYNTFLKHKKDYEKLCRNELTVSEKVRARLKCRYVDFGRPFLKLAKIKEEEAFLNPRVVIYHEVLSDREINVIKNLSVAEFETSRVFNSKISKNKKIFTVRISKVAWLQDFVDSIVTGISQRVEDITGLDVFWSEPFQIVNYGIGGFYALHYDFHYSSSYFDYINMGNRVATFLFYMSDVPLGGATVFPLINVTISPKKGSAVFWYNLKENGQKDFLTLHGSCPVVIGSKWICNKWVHEWGQEFRRPCKLTEF